MNSPIKAMVLAAGLGTRLRPLTDDRPKALVEVAGRTMLEFCLTGLGAFGVREAIVNVHHFADQVIACLKAKQNFGMRLEISREDTLLDTGGGLKKAAWFFLENAANDQPFILHNVDVLSTIDLGQMIVQHVETRALATLAVQNRSTSRYLLFDRQGKLCGRRSGRDGTSELSIACPAPQPLAFSGIHIISPRLLPMLTEDGAFSIINSYLRLAARGEIVSAFRADEYYWRDLGRPENIAQATEDFKQNKI
jgi:NDP-sugar pyrophosphorylase family protein